MKPSWYVTAKKHEGFHEKGNNSGIDEFLKGCKCYGHDHDPWCAIFMNFCLETNGIKGTGSPLAQSFRRSVNFVKLAGPARGAITVFQRGGTGSPLGHVGMYSGENSTHVWVTGGNENDAVRTAPYPKKGPRMRLLGYWWPKDKPLPEIAPVRVVDGVPEDTSAT